MAKEQPDYVELNGQRYVTPPIGARRAGLKVTRIYKAIEDEALNAMKIGSTLLILETDFWKWVPKENGGERIVRRGRPTDKELAAKNRLRIKPENLPQK